MFTGFIEESIIKRAIEKGVVEVSLVDIREYYVVDRCIKANTSSNSHIVMMTPQGETYNQKKAEELSKLDELVILCGHYEGFDERIRSYVDEEVSIGDFVLTGGEIAAMVISDSVIRLLDHAIRKESHMDDSFSTGLLEYPQYTRPIEYDGMRVPDVLLSGNHKNIETFRKKESLRRTYKKRPDLLKNYKLNKEEEKLLKEIIEEEKV